MGNRDKTLSDETLSDETLSDDGSESPKPERRRIGPNDHTAVEKTDEDDAIAATAGDDDAPDGDTPNAAAGLAGEAGGAKPAPPTLAEWLTGEDAAEGDRDATVPDPEDDIGATLVGSGGFAPPAARAASMTVEDARREWGELSYGSAAPGTGASVQMPDPRSGRTLAVDVALRPGRLSTSGKPAAGDDFAVDAPLGKGGMGAVFRARQLSLGREVAVKVILPEHAAKERHRTKFIAEAVITGALDHPNIIPLHELGVTGDGLPFYAMKEVRGRPWSKAIRHKTEAENIDVLMAAADAVAFAHDRGVIHRDLKPDNVMLGDYGEVLLMDWGLAVPHFPDAFGKRVAKGRAGTPAYLAPEMARADDSLIGPASDIYLLGAILHEIITGHPPHSGQNAFACIANAANNVIRESGRDDELTAIARKAMAARPEDRYATVKEFQGALADYRRHEESLTLASHARDRLARAKATGAYEDFNRALFGFDEALALWDGNAGAKTGLREARLALAGEALRRGDGDLAISAVAASPDDPEFSRMREAATAQKRESAARRARIRRLRRLAAGLAAAVAAVLAGATVLVNEQRSRAVEARNDAVAQQRIAESERAGAEAARDEARRAEANEAEQRKQADAGRAEAERQARIAEAARDEARRAEAGEAEQRKQADAGRTEAERQTRIAEAARDEAKRAEDAARQSEAQAVEARKEAETARDEAHRERKRAEDALEDVRQSQRQLAEHLILRDNTRWRFDADEARARQAADASAAGHPARWEVDVPGGGAFALRRVPPGEFVMGSPPREAGRSADELLYPVRISRGFWLGETPLTRGQWRAVAPVESESAFEDPDARDRLPGVLPEENKTSAWAWRTRELKEEEKDLPATGISFTDIEMILLPALNARAPAGFVWRLPTEAEWEWAVRAGTPTPFYAGPTPPGDATPDEALAWENAPSAEALARLEKAAAGVAWLRANAQGAPHPVGRLEPNAWGLRDMHGNTHEIVADFYDPAFALAAAAGAMAAGAAAAQDPRNDVMPDGRPLHVVRGGSHFSFPAEARSAKRETLHADNRSAVVGVRLALAEER